MHCFLEWIWSHDYAHKTQHFHFNISKAIGLKEEVAVPQWSLA